VRARENLAPSVRVSLLIFAQERSALGTRINRSRSRVIMIAFNVDIEYAEYASEYTLYRFPSILLLYPETGAYTEIKTVHIKRIKSNEKKLEFLDKEHWCGVRFASLC